GRSLPFLGDTGATCSSLCDTYYQGTREKSTPSLGINGVSTPTFVTPPLSVFCNLNGSSTVHPFRLIPKCPVNLLGRDLLGILGATITCTPSGGIDVSMLCSETIDLSDVPSSVWASSKLDVGFVNCTPYKAKLKPAVTPIYLKQYPLSEAKVEGVRPMIQSFLEQGILKPVVSPYNTPINPVPK
ncbi:NYNRIN-like isoform X1, partial [Pelobates cultripes]